MAKTTSQKDLQRHWAKQVKDAQKSPTDKKQSLQKKDRNQVARERYQVKEE